MKDLTSPTATKLARSTPTSPTSPKIPIAQAFVELQAIQYFDSFEASCMKTTLGKKWTRPQCTTHALTLLVYMGVPMSPEEIEWMAHQPEEIMIPTLCSKLTNEQREEFETWTATLKGMLVQTLMVRSATDGKNVDDIDKAMKTEDDMGVLDAILKEAVINGSKEVEKLWRCQETWQKSMESRMRRLSKSAEDAEQAQRDLSMVEMQLDDGEKRKSKQKLRRALHGFVSGSEKGFLESAFKQWRWITIENTMERQKKKEMEEELSAVEVKIFQSKQRSLRNVSAALLRHARNSDETALFVFFGAWQDRLEASKLEKREAVELAALNERMSEFDQQRRDAAKKLFHHFITSNTEGLVVAVMVGWLQAARELHIERQLETQIDAEAAKITEFLKHQKAGTLDRLKKNLAQTDGQLCTLVWEKWSLLAQETRLAREMNDKLKAADVNLKKLSCRSHIGANNVARTTGDLMELNLLAQCLHSWELESKVNRVEKYFLTKMEGKRKQLLSVRHLFRNFADKLEEGLAMTEAGEDSSRIFEPARAKKKKMSGSCSLPNIHERGH